MPSTRISNWHYVCTLLSEKDRDLNRRIQEHNAKRNFSTKPRTPLRLIYAEACLNEEDAKRREDYLKTTQGRRFLKLRIRKYLLNKSG